MIGLFLVWRGLSIAPFTNKEAASAAFMRWCTDSGVDDGAGDAYFRFVTNRYPMINAGQGMILAGGTVAALALALALTARPETPWLRTPRHRMTFLGIGVGAMALLWAAFIKSLMLDLERQLFPWCADSVGIPMMGGTIFLIVLTVIFLPIGFAITRAFGSLPTPLFVWDSSRPTRSWIVTSIFATPILLGTVSAIWGLTESMSLDMPASVAVIYLLEATRSALLAPVEIGEPAG